MRRRDLLALAGTALAGGAGCLRPARRDPGASLGTAADDGGGDGLALGRAATVGDTTVSMVDLSFRTAVRYSRESGALGVYGAEDSRLVFVRLTVDGRPRPPLSAFALRLDAASYTPLRTVDGTALTNVQRRFPPYSPDTDPDGNGVWLLFEVPAERPARQASLTWNPADGERRRWSLREDHRETLAAPVPAFTVESVSVPDRADPDERPAATLTVRNTGTVDGSFVAALNYLAPLSAAQDVAFGVPAGETTTYDQRLALPGEGEQRLAFVWATGRAERTVRVGSGTATG